METQGTIEMFNVNITVPFKMDTYRLIVVNSVAEPKTIRGPDENDTIYTLYLLWSPFLESTAPTTRTKGKGK